MVLDVLDKEISHKCYGRMAVKLSNIMVDGRYQRAQPTKKEIRDMAEQWDDKAAGVVCLSLRSDGRYWCIDGQRRCAALELLRGSDAEIEAQAWIDLSPEEEAHLFGLLQNRKQLRPMDVYKADVFSGDGEALALQAVVREAGFEVKESHGKDKRAVNAVNTVRKIYRDNGGNRVGLILSIWRQADLEQMATAAALQGINFFLSRYPQADRDRVIERLTAAGSMGMERLAAGQRQSDPGVSRGSAWGRALRVQYNTKLRSNRLPEWPETVWTSEAMQRAADAKRGRPLPRRTA